MSAAPVNRSVIEKINRTYTKIFNDTLEQTTPLATTMERLGLVYTLTGIERKRVNLAWYRRYVVMRQWVNERQISPAEAFEFLMTNKPFEATVDISVEDMQDGVYDLQVLSNAQELANAYRRRKSQELLSLLRNAFTSTNTLDGVPLISGSHPYGSYSFDPSRPDGEKWVFNQAGTFSNQAPSNPALSETALWNAREAFISRTDFMGEPLGAVPTTLIVGPKNELTARKLLTRDLKVESNAAVDNETKGLFDYVVDPYLVGDYDDYWFLVTQNAPRKPFIFWDRYAPVVQMTDGMSKASDPSGEISETLFFKNKIYHGIFTRMGVAFGSPEYIYGSTGAGS